jgi:UDP-N-acetylmuramate: L-alanyl-gamma-D-glutamyl-meso-diaminopimelate ligase
MHLHILGICGTFMAGLALLARQLGHRVTGSDAHVYPPMSDQLNQQGITCIQGYGVTPLLHSADKVVIGNALSRGCEAVEYVLNQGIAYTSGAQFLAEYVLQGKKVLAVAGTHGKTTTSSLLAWILAQNGFAPSFLIGGIARDFGVSARLTDSDYFVLEADEYDTAFFDKRSKFIHYHPNILIINNLEFDHADIFPDLAAIQTQFHHLIRTVPSKGHIIYNAQQTAIEQVLARGCWSQTQKLWADDGWQIASGDDDRQFDVLHRQQKQGHVAWSLLGKHNQANALAAIAAADAVGVSVNHACAALARFSGVKRRLEKKAESKGICVYDDFAHHPTAIKTTLAGLRQRMGKQRIIAVLEPRSNTMRLGVHNETLMPSLLAADEALLYLPPDFHGQLHALNAQQKFFHDMNDLRQYLYQNLQSGDHVLIMSNGNFAHLHQQLIEFLS